MIKIEFILLLGLLINVSKCLEEAKNVFQPSYESSNCEGSVLVIQIHGNWNNEENVPTSDIDFTIPQKEGKVANCQYLKFSISFTCRLNGGGHFGYPDTTLKLGEDEYILKTKNNTISITCREKEKENASSMIYSSLLTLLILNILLI